MDRGRAILKELPARPLLAGEDGVRLSLAGAQDKIAVRIEGVVFNEAFCMKLAAAAGLPAAATPLPFGRPEG